MVFIKVASKSEIEPGKGKRVEINGKRIAILNHDGEFFAIDDTCVHAGGSLGEGVCGSGIVICPLHGWQYELKTGKCTFDPDIILSTYDIMVDVEDILVNVGSKKED